MLVADGGYDHHLTPESGAPHIETDDYVKHARGQLVTIFTESGNKGIVPIVAYQRQAYTSKGVVSQADNRIIHRLHATDRKDTARDLGIDPTEIEQLGLGEVLIYGDFTDQRVVGPEQVRRRTSPDPQEESFDLPEPPEELSDTLAAIAEDVEQREEQAHERRDRIEELEAEVDRLQEANEELRRDREVGQRIAEALERFTSGDAEGADGAAVPPEFIRDM